MSTSSVRVRFAPSPTGHLHIGGLRSALFNYLFARKHGGSFLIRIEDTDLERSKQEYTDSILASFKWFGIASDEEIVIQSQRISEHQALIKRLLDEKKAYKCYCTTQEVAQRLGVDTNDHHAVIKYDEHCRNRAPQSADMPYTVRFALPKNSSTVTFHDLIRGDVTFDMDQFDDFIIARSDGTPMYNFVVVADDAYMRISHIIRGEDHIPNTPKQIFLYQACGFEVPQFAHLPMILGPEGNRLSKRDAATSVLEYRMNGYLPAALLNYLVRLGWAHGDQEIFSLDEMISFFSLEAVGKKGAIFDQAKLDWLNSVYIRAQDPETLLEIIVRDIDASLYEHTASFSQEQRIAAVKLYQDRVSTLRELMQEIRLLAHGPDSYHEADMKTWISEDRIAHLILVHAQLSQLTLWDKESITTAIKHVCSLHNLKLVALAQPLRLALIGKTSGPGVFEMAVLIGQQETLQRIARLYS